MPQSIQFAVISVGLLFFSTDYSATNLWSWGTICSVLLLDGRFLKVAYDTDNPVTVNHRVPGTFLPDTPYRSNALAKVFCRQ
jgi:hypothetical protein